MGPMFLKKKNPINTQSAGFWVPEKGGAAPPFEDLAKGLGYLGCRIFVWPFEDPVLRDKTVDKILK